MIIVSGRRCIVRALRAIPAVVSQCSGRGTGRVGLQGLCRGSKPHRTVPRERLREASSESELEAFQNVGAGPELAQVIERA